MGIGLGCLIGLINLSYGYIKKNIHAEIFGAVMLMLAGFASVIEVLKAM